MLSEIKKTYDGKAIQEIESLAEAEKHNSESSRRTFIEALFYLNHTKRFRENKQYKDASFDEYLRGRFMMTEAAFERERVAYVTFPELAVRIGPGTVCGAIKKLGATKAGKVLKAIPNNAKLETIEKAISDAAPKKGAVVFSGPTKPELKAEIASLKDEILALNQIIVEKDEQIEKLKATVRRYEEHLSDELVAVVA